MTPVELYLTRKSKRKVDGVFASVKHHKRKKNERISNRKQLFTGWNEICTPARRELRNKTQHY